ncbi:MAG TPA: hypothetical protein VFN87_15790 [Solirubrobacteraceae bacterium]|nr:hypothetical protein [Solirubrobacteraceae bacterium]
MLARPHALIHRLLLALAVAGFAGLLGLSLTTGRAGAAPAPHHPHRRLQAGHHALRARGRRHRPRRHLAAHTARDPQVNRTLSQGTLWACETQPSGSPCVGEVLAAINAAHAAEGVPPMRLPAGFAQLSIPEQLLVVSNAERVDRGLIAAVGLSRNLNRSALAGAQAQRDPVPSPFYGDSYGSNWAGGIVSALADDFLWMYDDGPGSFNIDCRSPGAAGCWGHRHNILYRYQAPLAMGAAIAGSSATEVFVGGDYRTAPGQPDAPMLRRALR